MSKKRTPLPSELAALSREEWQQLCAGICAVVFQAQRVEDALGKGNGLDAWRQTPAGPEGYQHRRFDARFERAQAAKLKDNIALACERAPGELGGALRRFTIL
jgi:hypothetical protein